MSKTKADRHCRHGLRPWECHDCMVPAAEPEGRRVRDSCRRLVLDAAASLVQPFHKSDLVIRAWERNPDKFGLKGRERLHPSDNLVMSALYGYRGLVALGYLEKTGVDCFRLTEGTA